MRFLYFNSWVRNIILYFFLCLLGLITLLFGKTYLTYNREQFLEVIINGAVVFLIAHVQAYIHNVFLYQKHFSKNNVKYITSTLLLFGSYFAIDYYTPFKFVQNGDIVTMCVSIFLVYLIGLGFYYAHKNILERNLIYQNELIERDEEIRHLKAQLNPHFLFNALNNLYGTALTEPNETPDKILELSDLLRYQIESSQKERVFLEEEIDFIRKYLNYEQNRNAKLSIEFKTVITSKALQFSPMLFMPFIENAIKYSAQSDKPFTNLHLQTDKRTLKFMIENNFSNDRRKFSGTNTGINNTKKRLELTYKNKYDLSITDTNGIYRVRLVLTL
jgi:sensor histidine kinase YesM